MAESVSFMVAAGTPATEQDVFDAIAAVAGVVSVHKVAADSKDLELRRMGLAKVSDTASVTDTAADIGRLDGVESATPAAQRWLQ